MINITIPYDHTGKRNLGKAYNEVMEKSEGWTLLLDHDVYLKLTPHYYDIMLNAVKELGDKAGWITCYTNRIGCWWQQVPDLANSNDIEHHKDIAQILYERNKGQLQKIDPVELQKDNPTSLPSGFFILTNKKAWEDAGGFKDGFEQVDNKYALDLADKGYEFYLMRGLYVYHHYGHERP